MKKDSSANLAAGLGLDFEYFNQGHEERYKKTTQKPAKDWRKANSIIGKELILL